MIRALVLALSALSANAFVLPAPGVSPLRTTVAAMQEQQPEPPKAPSSGWTLTLGGGTRSVEDVYAAQKKAAKSLQGKDGECDIKETQKGWTTY
eukprot:CAMPEP_0115853282 /NCGR_PEP_ID=MMETSP0287-20121206/13424_1 /TAXON_ID=412157 /ORGANISM="Chrysochromulina rotalis, Strain UIO044" /LENGTH=93 /DNA_ID=CAMNT_0003307355 /DNA_START=132 /DNA_END=413 /DNA_ORIENTATION=-